MFAGHAGDEPEIGPDDPVLGLDGPTAKGFQSIQLPSGHQRRIDFSPGGHEFEFMEI